MTSKLIDLNILAIFLVEDHPGHPYVDRAVSSGLTNRWGIDRLEADRALEDFLQHRRVRYLGASRTTLQRAFELSKTLRHDVYDTFYIALAMEYGASAVLTTDRDFRALCRKFHLEYENPVPDEVLRRFEAFPKTR